LIFHFLACPLPSFFPNASRSFQLETSPQSGIPKGLSPFGRRRRNQIIKARKRINFPAQQPRKDFLGKCRGCVNRFLNYLLYISRRILRDGLTMLVVGV
jgi:hypothetical protein